MLLGIVGTDGAGKGAIVGYLVSKHGFVHYSSRALLVTMCIEKSIEPTRANLRLVANELRAKHGNDYLVAHYLRQFKADGVSKAIIESIRTTAEVETLRKHNGLLLGVDADVRTRYSRIQGRGSSSDHVTLEEFMAHEATEMRDTDPHGMQKALVLKMADVLFMNDGSLQTLYSQIEAWLTTVSI